MTKAIRPPFDAIRLPDEDPPFLHLCWMLHNQCNHRCSYCAEVNWGGSHRWLKLDAAIGFLERVFAHYPNRRIMVSFTGGEPTLWPDFDPFVEFLASRQVLIGMTTNGTRPLAFFEKYSRFFDWMSFSFHPEFTRPVKFLENVAEAAKTSNITVRAMMPGDETLWKKSCELIDLAKIWNEEKKFPSYIGLDLVPIALGFGTDSTRPSEYSPEQAEVFNAPPVQLDAGGIIHSSRSMSPLNRYGFSLKEDPSVLKPFDTTRLLSKNQTNFRGWVCDIGLEQLFIDEKGEISRAGCRVGGPIGHIFDERIEFPTKPIRCTKSYCHCNTDILTAKRSPEWDVHQERRDPVAMNTLSYLWDIFRRDTGASVAGWHRGEPPSRQRPLVFSASYLVICAQITRRSRAFRLLTKPYFFVRYQVLKRIFGRRV